MNFLAMILSLAVQIGMALVMFATPEGARDGFSPFGLVDGNQSRRFDGRPTTVFLQIEGLGFAPLYGNPASTPAPPDPLWLAREPRLEDMELPMITLELDPRPTCTLQKTFTHPLEKERPDDTSISGD